MNRKQSQPATIWVCTECLYFENGIDDGQESEVIPWTKEDVTKAHQGMVWSEHVSPAECGLTEQCECDALTFSKSPCDACGTPLAGARYAYTIEVN